MVKVVLHQFQFSHFNEKVRWALAHKGVLHDRKSYLPGPHMPSIRRLSGQTSTPVMEWDGTVIAGSARIIEFLEKQVPTPILFPGDAMLRQRAMELVTWLDAEVGPANRTVLFAALINESRYMTSMFSRDKSLPVRLLYRLSFPLARGLIARGNGVNPENVKKCRATTAGALNRIGQLSETTGYLVGDSFSVADLTAASLFAPLANPDHPDMARPTPIPPGVTDVLREYADHPTIQWVNSMYEKHRPV
ncbi:MAG: glutathione S-transferase family protein [Pseudomonadota bacterium]